MYKTEKVIKGIAAADEALFKVCDHGSYFIGDEADVSVFVKKAMSLCRRGHERVAMKYCLAAGRVVGYKGSLAFYKGTESDALDSLVYSDKPELEVSAHDTYKGCYYVGKEYAVSL